MATVLTVAITLIAGAALFGYVNGQAANSENKIAVGNAANVNFLNEKFVVVDLSIISGQGSASIWIYNNGNLTLNLAQIAVYNGSRSLFFVFNGTSASSSGCASGPWPKFGSAGSFAFGTLGTQIKPLSSPVQITLTLPSGCKFQASTTYYANVLGVWGNDVVYSTCDSTSGCTS